MVDIYRPMFEQFSNRKNTTTQGLQQAEQNLNNAKSLYEQHQEDYITGKRHPVADLIRKPERDVDKERRLKEVAKWSAIGDAVGLIGKGWAASQGVRTQPTEGATTYRALGELDKLDELYRQDGYQYNQMQLSEALRRQQSAENLAQFRFSNAQQEAAYAREQDALATRNLDVMTQQQTDRDYNSKLLAEGREYDAKRDDKNFKRQVALQGMSNTGRSSSSKDHTLFNIKEASGIDIPIDQQLMLSIINKAIEQGVISKEDAEDKFSGGLDFAKQVKIQELYNALRMPAAQATSTVSSVSEKPPKDGVIGRVRGSVSSFIGNSISAQEKDKAAKSLSAIDGIIGYLKQGNITDISISELRNNAKELDGINDVLLQRFFKAKGINVIMDK